MTPDEMRAEARRLTDRATELETQLSRSDLKDMAPEDINQARVDGRLNDLLGITKENNRNA